jgi:uncharacterized protein
MIRFEWDPVKARTNQRKHGVTFDDAMHVFDDPCALFEQDRAVEGGEPRWQALGSPEECFFSLSLTQFEKKNRTS